MSSTESGRADGRAQHSEMSIRSSISSSGKDSLYSSYSKTLFVKARPWSAYMCLAIKIPGPDLATFCHRYPSEILSLPLIKRTVQQILFALDFFYPKTVELPIPVSQAVHSGADLIV